MVSTIIGDYNTAISSNSIYFNKNFNIYSGMKNIEKMGFVFRNTERL